MLHHLSHLGRQKSSVRPLVTELRLGRFEDTWSEQLVMISFATLPASFYIGLTLPGHMISSKGMLDTFDLTSLLVQRHVSPDLT